MRRPQVKSPLPPSHGRGRSSEGLGEVWGVCDRMQQGDPRVYMAWVYMVVMRRGVGRLCVEWMCPQEGSGKRWTT